MLKEWFLHMQIVDKLRWYLQKGDMVSNPILVHILGLLSPPT